MLKIADLYIRVSTDEQANTGYSQRHQEEMLKRYCELNSIKVRNVFFEDHSAKSFNRPEWQRMLSDYKRNKGIVNLVLFLKWDRFSRNAGDSYAMINLLAKHGIEPQAVEQPLDLSVPENKMMLAFYLAAPEVENARRALNVLTGMRRARKEGRHMGTAPLGYQNRIYETGRKYIGPKEPAASIIRWVFTELATGNRSVEELLKESRTKGFNCSKNNFWHLIHNPIYCGKVIVPRYQQEEAYLTQGVHEPIISEELFYDVQDILAGRKKRQAPKTLLKEQFPLRNFLVCPKCARTATASSSKGRNGYYSCYHCVSSCGWRCQADKANNEIIRFLRKYQPDQPMVELYVQIIADAYRSQDQSAKNTQKELLIEIQTQNNRLQKARELLLTDVIDAADYKTIKSEAEQIILRCESKLTKPKVEDEFEQILMQALVNMCDLSSRYVAGNLEAKRKIIGSIFPEKLTFEENGYRTARLNGAVELIYKLGKAFKGTKKGQASITGGLYQEVILFELEPLTKLANSL